jgi:phosphoglycerate kinase
MNLLSVKDLKVKNKKVLLRTNYDVPLTGEGRVADETRIEDSIATLRYLISQKAAVIIATHLDRPGGRVVPGLSLEPVFARLQTRLEGVKLTFSREVLGEKTRRLAAALAAREVLLMENLRFEGGERENRSSFVKGLEELADIFVNDAFAVSHRQHASIVSLPGKLPSAFGLDFLNEIKVLSKILKEPRRPVVVILGGRKKSKISIAEDLVAWADSILIGGKLVEYRGAAKIINLKKVFGSLTKAGEDITIETVRKFKKIIKDAGTIIWSGPMGAFEERRYERGTLEIARAVAGGTAYTVVGGGDTEAALSKFGLEKKIGYISSGGGAMLSYLAAGTLPGIEAILENHQLTN